jgi:hypothetical protein
LKNRRPKPFPIFRSFSDAAWTESRITRLVKRQHRAGATSSHPRPFQRTSIPMEVVEDRIQRKNSFRKTMAKP